MSLPIQIKHSSGNYKADLHHPIDISIPMEAGPGHVSAWYVDPVRMEPVKSENWIGEVKQGGSVNFRNIFFNPHGHGTHTECVGHITPEIYSVNEHLKEYFCLARLITITPEAVGEDGIISRRQLEKSVPEGTEALVIRTLPNPESKLKKAYSNTNPPYLSKEAAEFLCERNVKHLLIDLPSVDREQDEGKLSAHHAFWNYPTKTRFDATITELVYIPDQINDGLYLLNLQVAPFVNDASPSRPVLFAITSV
ncbi:cyclase family protein [soil metagenome]